MQVDVATTRDAFLGGALTILQPKTGYRAATDPVFMAASIPARPGQSVLELGCGVGVGMLCLGYRVPKLSIVGLEIQQEYAQLAVKNARENKIEADIITGDLMQMPDDIKNQSFDHVMFNPPFYNTSTVSAPQDFGKSQAHVTGLHIGDWIKAGLKRLKPKGRLSFIHRVEILPQALGCLSGIAGDITVKPLTSRKDQPAKRIIVTCRKGTNGPAVLLPPLVIHQGDGHDKDAGEYSQVANSILREAQALIL
jgi:tRNA1(Val) A37 N6-methylase TrmN6